MRLLAVDAVCAARAPRVAAIADVVDGIARFLAPLDAPAALAAAVARRLARLASVLADRLASDPRIHFLDKRARARRAMAAAALEGDVALMARLYKRFGCHIDLETLERAVRGGHVDALEWLRVRIVAAEGGGERPGHELEYSAGDLKETFSARLLVLAAERGDLRMVQILAREHYARSKPAPMFEYDSLRPLRAAVRSGNSAVVEYLSSILELEEGATMEDDTHTGPCPAVVEGERKPCAHCLEHVVRFLTPRMKACECAQWRMDHAAGAGRLDGVRWFHCNRSIHGCTTAAMDRAATNGHLDVVRFLHENRGEGCTAKAMDGAAANGHLEVARYLRANRTEGCSPLALEAAAGHGDMAMVQWFVQGDEAAAADAFGVGGITAVTSTAMDRAAANGHLEVVQFLQANSREACSAVALVGAASSNHARVVRWLLEQYGDEWRSAGGATTLGHAAKEAAANGHLSIVKLLYAYTRRAASDPNAASTQRSSSLLRSVVHSAASKGFLCCVEWAVQTYRCDCSIDGSIAMLHADLASALNPAVVSGHFPVVRWIQQELGHSEHATVKRSTLNRALVAAAQRADFVALEWLRARHVMASNWARLASSAAAFRGDLEVVQWFCVEYNGEAAADAGDTPWGRRACVVQARKSQSTFRWLMWSPDGVGPV